MVGVVEPEAPDAHDGPAVLACIGGRGDQRRHLVDPVGLDLRLHVGPAGHVVHDVELAPVSLRRAAHLQRHRVARGPLAAVRVEALQGDRVAAVLPHPAELRVDRGLVVRREQRRRGAVAEVGVARLVAGGEFAHVGPRADGRVGRRGRAAPVLRPVPPAVDRRAVAGAREPALVADGDLADDVARRAGGARDARQGQRGGRRAGGGGAEEGAPGEGHDGSSSRGEVSRSEVK